MDKWTYDVDYGMSFRDCPFTIYYRNGQKSFVQIGGDKKIASQLCIDLQEGKVKPEDYTPGP